MNPTRTKKRQPEKVIQKDIEFFLKQKGWHVERMNASSLMVGFADIYATHKRYGPRWIEVKLPGMRGSKFTSNQMEKFPLFTANGSGVWVMTSATKYEYDKLFRPPNWWTYVR